MLCHNIAELFQKEITKAFIIFIFADTFDFRSTGGSQGGRGGGDFRFEYFHGGKRLKNTGGKPPVDGESLFVTNFQDWDGMIGLIDPGNPEVSSPVPVDTG